MRQALMMTVSMTVFASLLAETSQAQTQADEPAGEVTVIATRTEKKVADAPATVSVITAEQIENELSNDIKDLVRYEPGVSVRSSPARFTVAGSATGRDGNSGFNIRGLEGNRVLFQIDGIRVPDSFAFGAQSVGRGGYADLGLLKSVEILRGPASALYGSDSVAGAVSFTTKDPIDFLKGGKSFGGSFRAGYAQADDSWSKGLVLAGKAGKWSSMVAYTRRDGHEQETNGDINAANVTRTTANPQDIESNAGLIKVVYTPGDAHRLRLTVDHYDSVSDANVLSAIAVPPLAATSTLGLIAHDTTTRDRVSLDYRYRGEGVIDSADVAVYSQKSDTKQFGAEDRNTSADRTRLNLFNTEVQGLSASFSNDANFSAFKNTFTYGIDYSLSTQTSVRDGTVPPTGETYPTRAFPTTDYTRLGVFIQDEIVLGKLSLYPAVRYDSYDLKPKADALLTTLVPATQDGDHVSPKLGVVYKLTPQVNLFFNAAEGFKAPSPNEVNNAFANLIANYKSVPNPNLKPETSQTIEGGLRFRGDLWTSSFTVFDGDYQDFIDQVQVRGNFTATNPAVYQYINLGKVKISGFEAKGRAKIGYGFTLDLSTGYSRGTSTINGVKSALASIEPWKFVAGLNYRASNGRYGGAFSLTRSQAKDADKTGVVCTPSCYIPETFTIGDVTAWWNLTSNITLRAGVFNLTDEKYSWWGDARGLASTSTVKDAYTQPGRNASVSFTYRY